MNKEEKKKAQAVADKIRVKVNELNEALSGASDLEMNMQITLETMCFPQTLKLQHGNKLNVKRIELVEIIRV
jgi:hypothetical protein